MVDDILSEMRGKMDVALDALRRDLTRVRTGRANLSILDTIRVDYYGTKSPLNQVASLQVADARLIVIKPWERTMVPAIARTIAAANLGINPTSDGEVVRLVIPPLSEERRRDLVKMVKKMGEDARIALRAHRREANDLLKELVDSGDVPEDDGEKGTRRIQETTDDYVKKADDLIAKKEAEVMEV
jgi:ribosome recycling factor